MAGIAWTVEEVGSSISKILDRYEVVIIVYRSDLNEASACLLRGVAG